MQETQPKRRRLTPEERTEEILEAAAQLVMQDGIADLTMERIADRAGVSKGLLYAYFPNVKSLLQQVLIREHRDLTGAQLAAIEQPESFEAMARATAHNNHQRYNERGLLVARLRSDPEINAAMRTRDRKARQAVIDYLSYQVMTHFDLPAHIANLATELVIGPGHEYKPMTRASIEAMDDVWGAMMVGAMKELERRYGKPSNQNEGQQDD